MDVILGIQPKWYIVYVKHPMNSFGGARNKKSSANCHNSNGKIENDKTCKKM